MDSLETVVRSHLMDFPLYDPAHMVATHLIRDGCIWIGYRTENGHNPSETTHFDVNIIEGVFYVLFIEIHESKKGQGYGAAFYVILEKIAQALGCSRVEMTASGWTIHGETRASYLARRGYQVQGTIAQKHLKPIQEAENESGSIQDSEGVLRGSESKDGKEAI